MLKIKNWDFKQRLEAIAERLEELDDYLPLIPAQATAQLDEINQIVDYWLKHMKGQKEKPQKKKKKEKPVNLWDFE